MAVISPERYIKEVQHFAEMKSSFRVWQAFITIYHQSALGVNSEHDRVLRQYIIGA